MRIPVLHRRPPSRCVRLKELVATAGGEWAVVDPAGRITHRVPEAPSRVRDFFAAHQTVEVPEVGVGRVSGASVFGSGVVLSPSGSELARDAAVEFGRPFEDHHLLHARKLRRPARVPGTMLVAACTAGDNYYHWLLDELPRLLIADLRGCQTLLATRVTRFNREGLEALGWAGPVLPVTGWSHYRPDRMTVPGYVGNTGEPSRLAVRLLRDFADRVAPPTPGADLPEKVYVSRRRARVRRTANEDELFDALRRRGFHRVEVEDLTWREQVRLFRAARVVVAPHGAALANLVFCTPGCRVVEYFHATYMHWCYWQIASINGLDYIPVVSDGPKQHVHDMAAGGIDIVADVPAICRAVDA